MDLKETMILSWAYLKLFYGYYLNKKPGTSLFWIINDRPNFYNSFSNPSLDSTTWRSQICTSPGLVEVPRDFHTRVWPLLSYPKTCARWAFQNGLEQNLTITLYIRPIDCQLDIFLIAWNWAWTSWTEFPFRPYIVSPYLWEV